MISQTVEEVGKSAPGTPRTVLEVRDLGVAYGKVEALSNANLRVGEGQIVTVIG
ncbi:ABC transporter ATP-binding protein, partial [Aromatoleum toluclasticum]|nr:ABC transporter ATP-binding protein [Aromatoleum toluclasticum]